MHRSLAYLKEQGITYTLFEHPAVFTADEARVHCKDVPGQACKNLFLTDRKSGKYYLVTLPDEKRLDIKALGRELNEKSLRFASADELRAKLGLEPGSVSPLGLVNNIEHDVTFVVDKEVWDAPMVSIHPNVNTASLALEQKQFHKVVESFGNEVKVCNL